MTIVKTYNKSHTTFNIDVIFVLTEFLISWKPPCILTKTKPFVLAGGSVTHNSKTEHQFKFNLRQYNLKDSVTDPTM